jgi:hypothetical protein
MSDEYRARREAIEARRHRECLERGSPTDAGRFNFVRDFNKAAAAYTRRELPGLEAYEILRMAQAGARSRWDWADTENTANELAAG